MLELLLGSEGITNGFGKDVVTWDGRGGQQLALGLGTA